MGNFPGVTVDRKDGQIRGQENTRVTDLPGIYSMSPYSSEEIVSRNFVLDNHPKAIINIVGCYQYTAKSLPYDAVAGDGCAYGAGVEYDGRGNRQWRFD